MRLQFWCLCSATFFLLSCREAGTPPENNPLVLPDHGVFIINQGAWPNPGSVSFCNVTLGMYVQSAIGTSANWITPNDAKVVGHKLYVVINGSDKVEVRDAVTLQSIATIPCAPGSGPGFLCVIDSSRGYVANYDGTVSTIDLQHDSLRSTSGQLVTFPGGMVAASGKVFVSDYGFYSAPKNIIKILDASTLSVLDSVRVAAGVGAMASDGVRVYAACAGVSTSNGFVYAIDVQTHTVVDSLGVGAGPSHIASYGQSLFVLQSTRIMKLDSSPLHVRDSAFVTLSNGLYYYGMDVDRVQGDLYASKITSTGGSGQVEVYNAQGVLKQAAFQVGVFPGSFAFK